MKKILILILLVLFCSSSALGGEFEDALKKAEQGNAIHQLNLGAVYYYGKGTSQDYNKAFYWFKKAAEQNDTFAQSLLFLMYYKGLGTLHDNKQAEYWADKIINSPKLSSNPTTLNEQKVKRSHEQVFYWFKKAAEQDDAFAQIVIGFVYYAGQIISQNYKEVEYWWNKAAENGNAIAQCLIGIMYYEGKRVPQDDKKALFWLHEAAEQGDLFGQLALGSWYRDWDEVTRKPRDFNKSFHWYKKAAEQGNDYAQALIGYEYYIGRGTSKDLKMAIYWFKKAAEQGNDKAQARLGHIYRTGEGALQDYKTAIYWYKEAVKKGNRGQLGLALMYYNGHGVNQDYKKALYWIENYAERSGVIPSPYWALLVDMYASGKGTPQNFKKAEYWLKKAGELGYTQYHLGYEYYHGENIPQNYKQALYWFKQAAEMGDARAQNYLGDMYGEGQGVNQDYKQAFYWYKKSAEQGNVYSQFFLSILYYEGKGTPQNFVLTYVWESLAASQGYEKAAKNRDITAKELTPHQLGEAQRLAAEIQYRIDHPNKTQKQSPSISKTEKTITGSGTGFFITKDGYILTCHHVIKGAEQIKIVYEGNTYTAKLVRDDPNNDLALLKINGSFSAIAFSSKRSAKMGQEVFTIGFPNPGLQGVSAKFTEGTISSLTGFQDDLRLYQISLPIQPGNSGGALVNENGNILGVIMAMLDAKTTFKISGSMPQNVNYAVKSVYAQAMLDSLPEILNKLIEPARNKANAVERVKKSTVMVLSYE